MRMTVAVVVPCLIGGIGLAGGAVYAQSPASSDSSELRSGSAGAAPPELAEVLVSARKVTERLQDVPASVVALDANALANASVTSLADIGRAVPGVNIVSAAPGRNLLVIRGLGSERTSSMVGYYVDDIPIQAGTDAHSVSITDAALFDLARVEVLRGPQGTLYGASSMSGTIKYVTQQPDLKKFSGSTKLATSFTQLGGPNAEAGTIINVPLVEDVVAVRAAGFYRYNDGYLDRYKPNPTDYLEVLPGAVSKNVNTEATYGGRVAVKVQPTDYLTITPSAYLQHMRLGGTFSFDYPISSFEHPFQSRALAESSVDTQQTYALNVHTEFDWLSVTSSTSYFSRKSDMYEDDSKETYFLARPAQSSIYPVPFLLHYPNHNLTEELRASFKLGRVDGVFGAFYQHVAGKSVYDWIVPDGYYATFGDIFGAETSFYRGSVDLKDTQKAVFGEFNFAVTSRLKATLGGRQFRQEQQQVVSAAGVLQGGPPVSKDISASASGFTPKYGMSYTFSEDFMAYMSAAKGFREGGTFVPIPEEKCAADLAAIGLTHAPTQFEPDSLWSYELGAKTQWLEHRLTVNTDVYRINWKDVQQGISLAHCGFAFTGNFGTATSKGAELEVQYEPVASLRLGLQAAFNQAQLTSTVVGTDGVSGQTLAHAPKWSGSASAEYRRRISTGATLMGKLDFNTSSYSYRNFNPTTIDYVQAGYSLMNGRLSAIFDQWDVALFGTNLLDKRAATAMQQTYSLRLPDTYHVSLQRPRTVGVEVMLHY